MRTSKPLSTISYNTNAYLTSRLDSLFHNKIIQFWAYVPHLGENDEAGKKNHIHLYLEPNNRIDTDSLLENFVELDITKPTLPLRCLSMRVSRFMDWYLYSIHDRDYLSSKLLERKYHYSDSDIKCSDEDELRFRIRSVELPCSQTEKIRRALRLGLDFNGAVWAGILKPENLRNLQVAWDIMEMVSSKSAKTSAPQTPHLLNDDQDE